MSKKYIQVAKLTISRKNSIAIAAGVLFMLFSNEIEAHNPEVFFPSPVSSELIRQDSTLVEDNFVTLQLYENIESVKYSLDYSFKKSSDADRNCIQLAPAHKFLLEISSCVGAERATLNCNCEYKAVTHTLRLPHDFILSLTKPMDTIDDNKVMFSLMRNRKLLISDVVESSLLRDYITNVIHKLG